MNASGNFQNQHPTQVPERPITTQEVEGGRWFRRRPDCSSLVRLVCFPYAGGSARIFREWHDWCRPEVEVVPIELPGRGAHSQGPLIDRMDAMVERLMPAVEPLLDKPFAIFGHSMGALIGFELSRALKAAGRRCPLHLFASGMRPPHRKGQYQIHTLPDHQLIEALRSLNGTPDEIMGDSSLVEFYLPLLRADLRLAETYRYAPGCPLDHPITVFSGIGDITTPINHQGDWQQHTRSGCTVRLLDGDHFFIQHHAHLLAASILKSLGRRSLPVEFESVIPAKILEREGSEAEPVFSSMD